MAGMLDRLKSLLHQEREGSKRLTENKPDRQVAVCAILLEVAMADFGLDAEEQQTIVTLLGEQFALNQAEVEQLIALTEIQRAQQPDLWVFTNTLRRDYTPEEKLSLLVMVWKVIFADQVLDAHEELLMRKLPHMLAVNHSLVIKAKKLARGDADPL